MNTKTTPKDFFLHLGATIALYAGVIALINLAFSVIDYLQPDALSSYFASSSIAWPVSMLIVLIPILYLLEWMLVRDIRLTPEKKDIWIRKWRIHLTLFLAGATIVGDLIALINTYLSGEITSRFVYKILAILIICGITFAYYLLARISDEEKGRAARRTLAAAGLVFIVATIVVGFVIVGSPAKQRAIRFDMQRENDLTNIQWQIVSYWQRVGSLPTTLADLNDPMSGQVTPKDPESGAPYEFTKKAPASFELCATFALPTQDLKGRSAVISYPGSDQSDLTHQAGRTCFSRTVDPKRYPVNSK